MLSYSFFKIIYLALVIIEKLKSCQIYFSFMKVKKFITNYLYINIFMILSCIEFC